MNVSKVSNKQVYGHRRSDPIRPSPADTADQPTNRPTGRPAGQPTDQEASIEIN